MAEPAWRDALPAADLEPGWGVRVEVAGRPVALFCALSGVYATAALCTHGGADLCDGYVDGHLVECPLHQGAFDVRDGRPLAAPATRPLRIYPCRVVDGVVQVRL